MDFNLSEEQTLLTDTVEKFAIDRYGDGQRARYLKTNTGFDAEGWRIMAEAGLFAVPFSEASGGLGARIGDLICMMKPLGKRLVAEPILGGPVLAGALMDRIGATDHVAFWAPKIIAGEAHLALAHAEKAARFRLDYVDTRFEESDGRTTLSGRKTFALAAAAADAFIVTAIEKDWSKDVSSRAEAIRFFLVSAAVEGVTRRNYRLTDGSVACELDLTSVEATPMDGGFSDLEAVAAWAKIAACADMVGVMEMLFEATLDYVKVRKQFGQPIGKFQVIQHRLADLFTWLEFARSHLFRLASLDIDCDKDRRQIAGTKAFISETAIALAEEAVQLHGGMGVTDELPIGDGLKRIVFLSTLFGDASTEMARYA
jgi:alkylation response protein AidB-like acyl-CoA dehydrogenase